MSELLHGIEPYSLVMARISWRHPLLLSLTPHAYAAVFLRPAYGDRVTSVSLRSVTRRVPSSSDTALWHTSSFDTSWKISLGPEHRCLPVPGNAVRQSRFFGPPYTDTLTNNAYQVMRRPLGHVYALDAWTCFCTLDNARVQPAASARASARNGTVHARDGTHFLAPSATPSCLTARLRGGACTLAVWQTGYFRLLTIRNKTIAVRFGHGLVVYVIVRYLLKMPSWPWAPALADTQDMVI